MDKRDWTTDYAAGWREGYEAALRQAVQVVEGIAFSLTQHGTDPAAPAALDVAADAIARMQPEDECCHKTRLAGAPCPVGRVCPHIKPEGSAP
jgi:hypothetical protein